VQSLGANAFLDMKKPRKQRRLSHINIKANAVRKNREKVFGGNLGNLNVIISAGLRGGGAENADCCSIRPICKMTPRPTSGKEVFLTATSIAHKRLRCCHEMCFESPNCAKCVCGRDSAPNPADLA